MSDSHDSTNPDVRRDERPSAVLAEALDALPRGVEPERDLWLAIAARLEPRTPSRTRTLTEPRAAAADAPPTVHRPRPAPWRRLAAAVAWMAVGALAALGVDRAFDASPARLSAQLPGSEVRAELSAPSADQAVPARAGEASFAVAEADLLRVKDRLWRTVVERRDRLSPVTLDAVERNLEIIELAVRDLQHALAADPANPRLERALLDSHRRGIDLLRRVAQEA